MTRVEEELWQTCEEIRRIATQIPLPGSPNPSAPTPKPLQLWCSPVRPPSTSAPTNTPPPLPNWLPLRSPIQLPFSPPTRKIRPPAVPANPMGQATSLGWRKLHRADNSGPPSTPPTEPTSPPLPPTPSPRSSSPKDQQPTITLQELVQLVAEGVARAQQYVEPKPAKTYTSRLKIENQENFDRKSTMAFNQ